MSHTSPASFLVWAVLSVLFCIFLLFHLWSFDHFRCLKWNNGFQSGAFKRIMTYCYILSVPCMTTYAIGFAYIKYSEGFILLQVYGIQPKPWQLWSQAHQNAIFPLYIVFTISWSLEMVTHLEELCFWLFLVNAGAVQQNWFKSMYFKMWVIGALAAVIYLPLVSIFTRTDPLMCEAYTFLAGSLGSFSITIGFLPVLWKFPVFLEKLKVEGADRVTVVRLTKFHELNTIRVFLRFCMTIPLIVLGIDGARPHTHKLNENMALVDLLVVIASFGCTLSSAITLVIFFPRNIESEIRTKEERSEDRKWKRLKGTSAGVEASRHPVNGFELQQMRMQASFPHTAGGQGSTVEASPRSPKSQSAKRQPDVKWHVLGDDIYPPGLGGQARILQPNNRKDDVDIEMGGTFESPHITSYQFGLTEQNLTVHNVLNSKANPLMLNYISPLESMNGSGGDAVNSYRGVANARGFGQG